MGKPGIIIPGDQQVFIPLEDIVASWKDVMVDVTDVAEAVVDAVTHWAKSNNLTFGHSRMEELISEELIQKYMRKTNYSLDELIQAREEIAKQVEKQLGKSSQQKAQ